MSDRNGDFGAFVSGFVIGGLVGAAAALLLAPQSGEETRTLIRDKGIELKDQVEQTASDTRARAEELAKEARTKAGQAETHPHRLWLWLQAGAVAHDSCAARKRSASMAAAQPMPEQWACAKAYSTWIKASARLPP